MIPNETDCATLLQSLKEGKGEAFKDIFYAFYKRLCVYSVQFTESLQQSEDIVQELFINIWERKLYLSITNLRVYLFTAVRNRSAAAARRNVRSVSFDEIGEHDEDVEYSDFTDEELLLKRHRLQVSLAKLPPKEYEVLTAIILNSKHYKEVADEMGISVNTVKTHLSRALKTLRRQGTLVLLSVVC